MNSQNRRFEAGGHPAQGPHPDVANPMPSPTAGEDFPDPPHDEPAERPQDQPDLDAFAARMGTDRIEDGPSTRDTTTQDTTTQDTTTQDSASQDSASQDSASQDSASQDCSHSTRDWRAPVATAFGGLASGARTAGERLKGVSEKLISADADGQLDLAELRQRAAKVRTVMFTSIDEHGTLSSRPLDVQTLSESGDVHFVVGRDADWVSPVIEAVNVAFVDGSSSWISVSGRAVVVDDDQLLDRLWNPLLDTYFPDGRESAVVVRVESDRWEYWTAPNKLRQLVDVAKARIGKHRPDSGQSGTIET